MKFFLRAVGEGMRHWPALVAAVLCSVGIAVLWGANIAALFPLIETTLSGESIQERHAARVADLRAGLQATEAELVALRAELPEPGATDKPLEKARRLREKELDDQLKLDRASLASAEWLQGRLEAWLPEGAFATVIVVATLVLTATMLRVLLMLANTTLISHVTQSVVRDIRSRLFNKALELDRTSFHKMGISGFQAQIAHTADLLAIGITSFFSGAVTEPLRIICCLGGAFLVSWRLTLASLVLTPLAAVLVYTLNRRVNGLSVKLLDRSLGFHHVILEVLGGHHAVQSNTMEPYERDRFREATGEMKSTAMLATFYNALAHPITELFGMGMLCIGMVASSYLVISKSTTIFGIPMCDEPLTIAAVTVFFGLLIGAADPLRKFSAVVNGINNGMAAAGILYPILDWQSAVQDPEAPAAAPERVEAIELRGVTFGYEPSRQVLRDASLVVRRGDRVAVVGPNGGGKSTLVNLLCRYYDPQQGEITINGAPLKSLAIHDIRSLFAVVSQQTELFNESVLHNIRYGRWEATDEEVEEAARLARAHDFVSALPEGYATVVGSNGHRLSGGQRQRVALARAFLRGAEVLVLDEATSQVDVESERLIHEALAEYSKSRTVLFITHRESTLSLATRTVLVEGGKIVEITREVAQAA